MSLGDIVFVKGEGGLGRPLAGEDYISSLIFYTDNGHLPSGWTTTARIRQLFSVAEAEAAGITNDYVDATAAVGGMILTRGATGDTIEIIVKTVGRVINNNVASIGEIDISLGKYKQKSSDTTLAILGASLSAFINASTYIHGFTTDFDTDTLDITYPKSQGIYPNSGTPITTTIVGTITATITQPVDEQPGVTSNKALWHYHISEYFRIQPKGQLYVAFYPIPDYTYSEITTVQNYAQGKIRQFGIWLSHESHAFTSGDLTAISNQIVTNCDANHKPTSALYAADLHATADLTTLTNLNTLSANKASAVISQDGAGQGAFLYATYGFSISTLGAALGAVSFAAVSDNIKWIAKFNISNGFECDTPAFCNGVLVGNVTQSFLNAVDNLRYIFLFKPVGNAGSYFNNSHTAIISTSDYAYIENNRTIDKATRGIYSSLLPALGSPIVLNADGTLTDTSIAYFQSLTEVNLTQMVRDSELSAFGVLISPTQDVLSTGKLVVAVELLPIGVTQSIQVNIGFVLNITT